MRTPEDLSKQKRPMQTRKHTATHVKRQTRLIIDANCTTCGLIENVSADPFKMPGVAMQHAAHTGHVVILNGTADVPGTDMAD